MSCPNIFDDCTVTITRGQGNTGTGSHQPVLTGVRAQYIAPKSDLVAAMGEDALAEFRFEIDTDVRGADHVIVTQVDGYDSVPAIMARPVAVTYASPLFGDFPQIQAFVKVVVAR